jgi:hypothetical protein
MIGKGREYNNYKNRLITKNVLFFFLYGALLLVPMEQGIIQPTTKPQMEKEQEDRKSKITASN